MYMRLARDIRREQIGKAAIKARHRERLAQTDKWGACPNSGFTIVELNKWTNRYEWTTPEAYVEPLAVFETDKGKRLVCHECMSVWSTHTDFKHP